MAIGGNIFELCEKIGYEFADISYLENALTHSSYSNEQRSRGIRLPSNQRLEFLGDAVLEIVISDFLYRNFRYSEGTLTKIRRDLVRTETLTEVAKRLDLGQYLNLGNGDEKSGGRSQPKVLADALEAVFAAVYLDSVSRGRADYASVILSVLSEEIDNCEKKPDTDYKTALQQLVEKDGTATLEYEIAEKRGPEHAPIYTVICKVNNNEVGRGTAGSVTSAQMEAARVALPLFGIHPDTKANGQR